eukprot:8589406-Alexandrium_andersonii.AAC.1
MKSWPCSCWKVGTAPFSMRCGSRSQGGFMGAPSRRWKRPPTPADGTPRSLPGCWTAQERRHGLPRTPEKLRRASLPWASSTSGSTGRWPGGGWDAQRSKPASANGQVLGRPSSGP